MKRIFLAAVILLVAGITVYAQEPANQGGASRPTSSQTKQEAQQYLAQVKANASQFESTMDDHNTRSASNKDADAFNRIKAEIDRLEARINSEQSSIDLSLRDGRRANQAALKRVQQLMEQHKAKTSELEAFLSSS